mmetsp:Transcript_17619/g.48368  ORF Transcript_17619/g.48368 Transcript_17619/m.48368 type:complete len:259 (-) Transcript_17619:927-1703(-)
MERADREGLSEVQRPELRCVLIHRLESVTLRHRHHDFQTPVHETPDVVGDVLVFASQTNPAVNNEDASYSLAKGDVDLQLDLVSESYRFGVIVEDQTACVDDLEQERVPKIISVFAKFVRPVASNSFFVKSDRAMDIRAIADAVNQRRLADVRPADHRDEWPRPRRGHLLDHALPCDADQLHGWHARVDLFVVKDPSTALRQPQVQSRILALAIHGLDRSEFFALAQDLAGPRRALVGQCAYSDAFRLNLVDTFLKRL